MGFMYTGPLPKQFRQSGGERPGGIPGGMPQLRPTPLAEEPPKSEGAAAKEATDDAQKDTKK